jgi:hypothetical protein
MYRGPGFNNWDLTILKKIPLGNEARYIQLQAEMFNVFNHTQYLAIDDAARFDPAGNQVNARFGQVTAVRPPRYIQVGLTLYF